MPNFPFTCYDGHALVGFWNGGTEGCPACRYKRQLAKLREELEGLKAAYDRQVPPGSATEAATYTAGVQKT